MSRSGVRFARTVLLFALVLPAVASVPAYAGRITFQLLKPTQMELGQFDVPVLVKSAVPVGAYPIARASCG